jgi:hypothetical protein
MIARMNKEIRPVGGDKSALVGEIPAACADEARAVEFMEAARWGDSPACVHCGSVQVYQMKSRKTGERSKRWLWRCLDCLRQYSVRVGTIMEDSPIPVRFWCFAFWSASAGKKGISALQMKRMTGLSYKSALFMMHRIRWAMADGPVGPLTGTVEVDETYMGGKPRKRNNEPVRGVKRLHRHGPHHTAVLAAVQRGGSVRASHEPVVTGENVRRFLAEHVDQRARLMTDESRLYTSPGEHFGGGHFTVKHSVHEYARGEAHINTAEGFFSLLKRQIYGTHHAVSVKHLHRYVSEAAFKYNTRKLDDGQRTLRAIKGGDGKRLRYRPSAA